jgi:hypothetical protein
MVRRRGAERVEKYKTKKDIGMAPNYEAMVKKADVSVYNTLADLEAKVGALLTEEDVSGNFRIAYLNFMRALWSNVRRGTLTQGKLNALKAYFVAQKCEEAILDRIREIVAPSTPA